MSYPSIQKCTMVRRTLGQPMTQGSSSERHRCVDWELLCVGAACVRVL